MPSSGNFAVLNTLTKGSRSDLEDGNTTLASTTADNAGVNGSIGITSGKWYWEVYITFSGTGFYYMGLNSGYEGGGHYHSGNAHLNGMSPGAIRIRGEAGTLHDDSSSDDPDKWGTVSLTSTGVTSFSNGDIMMLALDYDNKKLWFGKNGTFFNSGNPSGGSNQQASWTGDVPIIFPNFEGYHNNKFTVNFGSDSSFAGRKTSGSANATDSNSIGNFFYTPPASFLALSSANLPISDDIDPAQTNDDIPQKQFGVVTYTGNQPTGQTVNSLGFKPDLIWAKMRSSTQNNMLLDSSRLNSRSTPFMLQSDLQGAEIDDQSQGNNNKIISSFNTDGFTLGGSNSGPNDASRTYVAWCWRANGGVTSSNSDGATASVVQANTKAGFSICTYTGFSGASGTSTVGHGLQKAPEFIITKSRNSDSGWWVQHVGLSAVTKTILLNSNAVEGDYSGYGSLSAPTSSVFSINGVEGIGGSAKNYIAYVWHSVEGFSKFGKYEGNANADGAFIYTGFRPRMIILRAINVASDGWLMYDTARETFNVMDSVLQPHLSSAEYSNAAFRLNVLSNGFKLRSSDNAVNGTSYDPYIYMAWGDVPFKYNNTF